MEFNTKSTAGIRQFEQTAVNKLIAEGVPRHVAHAFVHIGLPKSGRIQAVKDHVCKMKYEKFLIERTDADFKDPFRVGRLVPHVEESRMNKFFTEFAMNDLDAAKFSKSFPEFEVISRGKNFNQHAFYANKRYAECELLMSMVFKDASVSGLNPRSVIDLGGNDTWHAKRGRDFVHCDCPILSHRDIMRYKTRAIFSSVDTTKQCKKKFGDCDVKADYAIGVHSTYDITPKRLAADMHRKGVRRFYGVINYIPGVETKPAGLYMVDGMKMKMVRPSRDPPYVLCSFVSDPSLEYRHALSTLKQYLYVHKRYEFVDESGKTTQYVYRIDSVRGNSLVFSIVRENTGIFRNDFMWSPPTKKMYYISLKFLNVKRMEVDAELFDRLVLQAGGARNAGNFDIVSLYRYAKSLRQRVSINNIVLSSGYIMDVDQLVYVVIAAFSVSVAYRHESADYFKNATQQIVNLRGRGFLRNIFRLGGKAFLSVLLALPVALGRALHLDVLNDRVKALVASKGAVEVELDKPHASKGFRYTSDVISSKRRLSEIKEVIRAGGDVHDLAEKFSARRSVGLHAQCEGTSVCFLSRGVVNYDANEMPPPTSAPRFFDLSPELLSVPSHAVETMRDISYKFMAKKFFGYTPTDTQMFVLPNADRLIRKLPYSRFEKNRQALDSNFLGAAEGFIIMRGVGRKAVMLSPPPQYEKRGCSRFILFYDSVVKYSDYDAYLSSKGVRVEVFSPDTFESSDSTAVESSSEFVPVKDDDVPFIVTTRDDSFVLSKIEQGQYFMSGGLGDHQDSPPAETDHISSFLSDRQPTLETVLDSPRWTDESSDVEYRGDAVSVHSEASETSVVESCDVVPGINSITEFIFSCGESEKVAIASGKMLMELVIALSRGEAPYSKVAAVAQACPGNPVVVKVIGDRWTNYDTGAEIPHMAVTDGAEVFDKITKLPCDGVYVTSDVMRVYTGAAIRQAVEGVVKEPFRCDVICVDGPAGAGKTYTITHTAAPGDVVLCETSGALKSTARDLLSNVVGWKGHAYTADSYLMHVPVRSCNTLFLDEAYRLHAGKVFAIIKLLKPKRVVCYGDEKQIPALSYIPGFEFVYHKFPFTRVERKYVTYRLPADVAFALSTLRYYDFPVRTRNCIMRSVLEPKQFVGGMFQSKPDHVALLVFTQTVKEELVHQGVKHVMTIGEAQGATFDHVQVFRHTSLPIALFYDREQALVAITRSRRTFQYVTADALFKDDSFLSQLVVCAREKANDVLLSSHLDDGVMGVADASTYDARQAVQRTRSSTSVGGVSSSAEFDYVADDMNDLYFGA